MHRYRWFLASWPYSIRELASRLKLLAFSEENSVGFVTDRVREDYIQARYVERLDLSETIVDPFGRESSFSRIEFVQCELRISHGKLGLELIDAPRSIQGMLSRLAEVTEFRYFIESVVVDVLQWAGEISSTLGVITVADSLQIGSLNLERGIEARAVVKGVCDVRAATFELTRGRKHVVEKIQLKLTGRLNGRLTLSNNGTAKVEADQHEAVVEIVRECLGRIIRKENVSFSI